MKMIIDREKGEIFMKKCLCLLLVVILVIGCSAASACGISNLLKKTTQTVASYTVVGLANTATKVVVGIAQKTKVNDAALAVKVANGICDAAANYAAANGVKTKCVMEQITIDNQVCDVDPLMVVPGSGGGKH